MIFTHTPVATLGLVVLLAIILGCGAAPASQAPQAVNAAPAPKAEQPSSVPAAPAPVTNVTQLASDQTETVEAAEVKSGALAVEVGYKVGMRTPNFGMTLFDGTKLTS